MTFGEKSLKDRLGDWVAWVYLVGMFALVSLSVLYMIEVWTSNSILIRTDMLTGCQYVTTHKGGLQPRMDRNGFQMCN